MYQPVRLPVWAPCTSSSPRCGHCYTLCHGTFVFQSTLVQPSPVLPCPALGCPCPRQSPPPMFPASIGLDTNSLTTARSTTATDCLTVAHPVPSLHACRTRGRPGSVWYLVSSYRVWSPAQLRTTLVSVEHNVVLLRHCALCQGVGTWPKCPSSRL